MVRHWEYWACLAQSSNNRNTFLYFSILIKWDVPPWGIWLRTIPWFVVRNEMKEEKNQHLAGTMPATSRASALEANALPLCYNHCPTLQNFKACANYDHVWSNSVEQCYPKRLKIFFCLISSNKGCQTATKKNCVLTKFGSFRRRSNKCAKMWKNRRLTKAEINLAILSRMFDVLKGT